MVLTTGFGGDPCEKSAGGIACHARPSMRLLLGSLAMALGSLTAAHAQPPQTESRAMFDERAMSHLNFLVGRWTGTAPDGSIFYEEYDRPNARTLRSRRFKDQAFEEAVDGSTVALTDEGITSTWGDFTWRATRIEDGLVEFEPINAPSAFSWRRVDHVTVEVVQRWTDEKDQPQRYALRLTKVR